MNNSEIANAFDEMADLLEISGESFFRVKAYRTGSQVIRDSSESIESWVQQSKDLTQIDGIGSTLAEKTIQLVTTGHLKQLEELRQKVPPSLRTLLNIPGLGAKKVGKLYTELGIRDLAGLKQACERNEVQKLKGFAAKTEKMILEGLAIAEQAGRRMWVDQADALVESLRKHMNDCKEIERFEFAGSYRRKRETVGDIDILAISNNPPAAMAHFLAYPDRSETLANGETKSSIRVGDAVQVDLRVVPAESWGAALQYFTGSKDHNVTLRGLAKKKGLKINEYGVFAIDDESNSLPAQTEEDIYASVGLRYIPPELRENRHEWESKNETKFNSLIELQDIRGDMHMHTTATDGENSLREMVDAARRRGLEYIAITDHSQRVSVANGLDSKRLLEQWQEIDQLNQELGSQDFYIFKGIECDILENGKMDLPDDILAQADWVMASIHFGQKQSREEITERILNAIHHPSVSAISHPTGRLINKRDPYQIDFEKIVQACAKSKKRLEINANPWRLDLNDLMASQAASAGVELVISTDAHSIANLDLMIYGIQVARRACLTSQSVWNCQPLATVKQQLLS